MAATFLPREGGGGTLCFLLILLIWFMYDSAGNFPPHQSVICDFFPARRTKDIGSTYRDGGKIIIVLSACNHLLPKNK